MPQPASASPPAPTDHYPPPSASSPTSLPTRAIALTIGIALAAGLAGFVAISPQYRLHAEIHPDSASPDAVARLATLLGQPALSRAASQANLSTAALTELTNYHRLRSSIEPHSPRIIFECLTTRPARARALLDALLDGYRRLASTPQPATDDLLQQRSALQHRLHRARQLLRDLLSCQADTNSSPRLPALLAELDSLADQWRSADQQKTALTARLAALQAAPPPTARVQPAQQRHAEQNDTALLQDRKQLQLATDRLAAALAAAIDSGQTAFHNLHQALEALAEAVHAQIKLQPDSQIRRSLQAISPIIDNYRDLLARTARQWSACRPQPPQPPASQPTHQPLLASLAQAESLLRNFADSATRLQSQLDQQLRQIGLLDVNFTRRLVVQSALADKLHRLRLAQRQLITTGWSVLPGRNFRIDSYRQMVSGLARRVADRQAAIAARLQARANRQARQQRTRQIEQLQNRISQLQARQDDCVQQILARHRQLRAVARPLQPATIDAAVTATRQQIRHLQDRLASLNRRLDQTNPILPAAPGPLICHPSQIDPQPINRHVRLAAAGGLAGSCLLVGLGALWACRPRSLTTALDPPRPAPP